jgi:hypothetical protein
METGGGGKAIWESFAWVFTWGWVCALSAWGGAVSYFHHMDKHGLKFSLFRLAIDVWTSAFVGVLTYLLCQAAGISEGITAAMVGVSGHMGTRALFMLERKYEKFFNGPLASTDKEQ